MAKTVAAPRKKISKEDREKCRVLLPLSRLSYPHLFKAAAMEGTTNKPKFSATFLIPKKSDLKPVLAAMTNAKTAFFGAKDKWPKKIAVPYEDGDSEKNEEKDGYAGHWVFKASSNEDQRPAVVDRNGSPIIEASEVYAGCYVDASVLAYIWEFPPNSGRFGVGLILDGVRKRKEGEKFGGKPSADQMFGQAPDDEEDEEDMGISDDTDDSDDLRI